ncbi:hypothetical protein FSOLCH5_015323 [Fusarium solani]
MSDAASLGDRPSSEQTSSATTSSTRSMKTDNAVVQDEEKKAMGSSGHPEPNPNQTPTDLEMQLSRHETQGTDALGDGGIAEFVCSRISSSATGRRRKNELARSDLPLTDLAAGIVGWEAQDDPEMPLNFSNTKRWCLVVLVASMTLVSPFASSILSPGIGRVNEDFDNTSDIVGDMTVSIYLLGYVVGPLFLAPLSEMYGRKKVLDVSNAFFCVWQIGCALAPSIQTLIVFRFFCGVGGAGCLTLGGGVIGDVFHTEERGLAMGIWSLGPIFGPTFGPLAGGFIAENIGWRWDFWIVLMLGTLISTLLFIFNTETNHKVLIERKVARLKKSLGREDLRSCYQGAGTQTKRQLLTRSLLSPIRMLFCSPMVFFLSLYIAFVYGVMYLLFTTLPVVFRDTYGFSVGISGLVYISLGFGNILGWAGIVQYSDRTVVRLARANNGQFEPEMRLYTAILFGCLLPVTFFWYGWCAQYQTHWISPILSLMPFGAGAIGLFLPITTYLVDCYPAEAASSMAASTVFRSLAGAFLPLAGQPMYDALGLGWGNSLLGFICIGMIPFPLVFYRYGGRMRKNQ